MKDWTGKPLPPELAAEMQRLAGLPDETIDYSDAPEVTDWSGAVRGKYYKRSRGKVAVGIDRDLVVGLGLDGPGGVEVRLNEMLREWMAKSRPAAE